jgi:hypothetical protein
MLETTECIEINNLGRIYTDCMEFSLLRFLQLIIYNSQELYDTGKSQYIHENFKLNLLDIDNISNISELNKFINIYPYIYSNAEYYLSNNIGISQRTEWSTLLSDKLFFDYYRNDGAELFTSIENIINFFNGFFSMKLENLE